MRYVQLILIIVLAGYAESGTAQDLWLMKAHDVRRTGQSASNGPLSVDPATSWTVEISAAHTINVGASVTKDAAFFGSWGLLRKQPNNTDTRTWDKSDGTVYALTLATGDPFWSEPADLDLVARCYDYADRGPNVLWCGLGNPYEVSFYNGTVEGQAAIDTSRGTVYVGRGDGKLFALDYATGEIRWRYTTFNPALPDDPDGGGEVVTSPLLAPDGTVYFGTWAEGDYETNAVYAVNPDGSLRWRYPETASLPHRLFASPALSPDGSRVYYATFRDDEDTPGRIYAFSTADDEERLLWEYELAVDGRTLHAATLAVGSDGTVYVGGFLVEGFGVPVLVAVEDMGDHAEARWPRVRFSDGAQFVLGIALREEAGETRRLYVSTANLGTVFFNAKVEGQLYAIDPATGSLLASYDPSDDVPEAIGGINSPAIGADGTVYFGVRGRYGRNARRGHYFGVRYDEADERFERLWNFVADGYVEWSHPAIGPDGGIYAGSSSLDEQARTPTYPEGEGPEGTTAWFHAIKGPANPVASESSVPPTMTLSGPYPNPFDERATFVLRLDTPSSVSISIFDILGREVRSLADGTMNAGANHVDWDGRDALGRSSAPGIYVIRAGINGMHRHILVTKGR